MGKLLKDILNKSEHIRIVSSHGVSKIKLSGERIGHTLLQLLA